MLIQKAFENQGGTFLCTADEIANKLKDIKCFVFDWDGVFNKGVKDNPSGSPFSEPDSMGVNMLRFSYWLIHDKLPVTAIITGENNLTALRFAEREHLDAVYLNSKNKKETFQSLAEDYSLNFNEIAFFFDDILDLNAAQLCQLSFCIRRNASPLFEEFIINNNFCHYISAQEGGNHAVREITELIIGLQGNYDETIFKRMEYKGDYDKYLSLRNSIAVQVKQ